MVAGHLHAAAAVQLRISRHFIRQAEICKLERVRAIIADLQQQVVGAQVVVQDSAVCQAVQVADAACSLPQQLQPGRPMRQGLLYAAALPACV